MNILIITQMYSQPDDVGDNKPTKTVNYFAKEWIAMGHSVKVMHCPSKFPYVYYLVPASIKDKFSGRISTMTPSIESRRNLHRDENGIDVYRFPMLKLYPGQAFSKSTMQRHADQICKVLDKQAFKPDLVVGHFANPSAELVSLVAKKYNAKSSIVFHHDCDARKVIKYRLKENCARIGAIGARSITEAQEVQTNLALKELPFICCSGAPNEAVETAVKKCDKHAYENGIKFIYVGSLIKRKHLNVVIKAFSKVADYNDSLLVVGGGPEEEYLKGLTKELQLENMVFFTGRVPREQVLKYMKEYHVFTLISDDETYGMVYIEAMLQGCLTIASRRGGFDGIIINGKNGFICEPGNEAELIEIYRKIKRMTVQERNNLGQRAIDLATHYSEREVAERYLSDILERQQ